LIKYIRERCKILKRIAQQEGSTLRGYVVAQLLVPEEALKPCTCSAEL